MNYHVQQWPLTEQPYWDELEPLGVYSIESSMGVDEATCSHKSQASINHDETHLILIWPMLQPEQ
jgi:hypothetical protein